jgi:hypothetical protein
MPVEFRLLSGFFTAGFVERKEFLAPVFTVVSTQYNFTIFFSEVL